VCSLTLANDAVAALLNNDRTTAPCRLLAHFDRAHPVLGLEPYAKARTTDDDAALGAGRSSTIRQRFVVGS
jgi:hypothetical protein